MVGSNEKTPGVRSKSAIYSVWHDHKQYGSSAPQSCIGFYGTRTINGGLKYKSNQKTRYWDEVACFVREGEEEIFRQQSQSCVCRVERVHVYMINR